MQISVEASGNTQGRIISGWSAKWKNTLHVYVISEKQDFMSLSVEIKIERSSKEESYYNLTLIYLQ